MSLEPMDLFNIMDIELLSKLFSYNTSTGELKWLFTKGNRVAGTIAGNVTPKGYRYLGINGKRCAAHRVIWAMTYKVWPPNQIDHIDGNKDNNRLVNLRLATNSENKQNLKRAYKNNESGKLGVSKSPYGWTARIDINKRRINLGTFDTIEEAHASYLLAKKEYHTHYAE